MSNEIPACTLWLSIFISETSVKTGSNAFLQRLLLDFLPLKYCKLNYVFSSDHCTMMRILTLIARRGHTVWRPESEMRPESMHVLFGWAERPFSKSNRRVSAAIIVFLFKTILAYFAIALWTHYSTRFVIGELNRYTTRVLIGQKRKAYYIGKILLSLL